MEQDKPTIAECYKIRVTDLMNNAKYWKQRCLLAEKIVDVPLSQNQFHRKKAYNKFVEENPEP